MALFKRGSSLLEVQNRALIKTAQERAAQIDRLERELQSHDGEQADKLGRELQILQERAERQTAEIARQAEEIKRLTLERDFYSKRASALEQENRELTESATKYSLHAQKLEHDLTEVATKYSVRAQKLERDLTEVATKYSLRAQQLERELTETAVQAQKRERELTETATKYSLWGQKLELELARIDPDGAAARRFEA
jgi:chromosome segregation ATPase